MKTKAITLSAIALALSACDNAYTDWELPNVHRKNQPIVAPAPQPARTAQVQPEFEKPKPVAQPTPKPTRTTQVQPEFEKPKPVAQPAPKPARTTQVQPELPKPPAPKPVVAAPQPKPAERTAVAVSTLPRAQVQPEFEAPKPRPVQAALYTPRPVMTQAQKETFPVMPGQNRALKRRR